MIPLTKCNTISPSFNEKRKFYKTIIKMVITMKLVKCVTTCRDGCVCATKFWMRVAANTTASLSTNNCG